jgi:tRNA threonylcarbamoyladenosine biosynthesis protein TsaB
MTTLLAFDTATERMSIALAAHGRVWAHEAAGGAQASATLIPAIVALLAQAGVRLSELDAIAFGRGPGAFTGLRTACSVAQGLALGAGKPVLPVDTLLTVAQDASGDAPPQSTWVAMDARMNEIYAAHYACDAGGWAMRVAPFLASADDLNERWLAEAPEVVAGNALAAFSGQLRPGLARCAPEALPHARSMLVLAQAMWDRGDAVDAALALPL